MYRSSARSRRASAGTSRSSMRTIRGRPRAGNSSHRDSWRAAPRCCCPRLAMLLANPQSRPSTAPRLAWTFTAAVTRLRHHAGGRHDSLHLLRPVGRRQYRGLERAGRRTGRPARLPERRRLQQAGACPAPWCRTAAPASFVDASLGLRFHSDSAHLRGIKSTFTNAAAWPRSPAPSFRRSRRTTPTPIRTIRCTASGRRARAARCWI